MTTVPSARASVQGSTIVLHGGTGPVQPPEYVVLVVAHLLAFAGVGLGIRLWLSRRAA